MITPPFALTASERVLPKLALDFTTGVLDSRITFTRSGNTATYIGSNGKVQTALADTPRFDFNPTSLVCQGLLIEQTQTNLLPRSIPDAGVPTGWDTIVNTGTYTHSLVSGFGRLSSFQNVIKHEQTVSGRSPLRYLLTLSANTTYTLTVFFDVANSSITSGSNTVVQAFGFTSATGTLTLNLSSIPSSGVAQITFTTDTDTTGEIRLGIGCVNVATGSVIFGGWQLEQAAFGTSYIPTEASQVTRTADVATMTSTNFSDWYSVGAGGVVARVLPSTVVGTRPVLQFDDATANEVITLRGNTTNPELVIVDGGSPQVEIDAGTIAANTVYSLGAAWNTNNCAAAVNGAAAVTDATATIPTVTQARLGSNGTDYLNGHLQNLRYWPQRIINAEVQAFSK
jgi:hypothetical protein